MLLVLEVLVDFRLLLVLVLLPLLVVLALLTVVAVEELLGCCCWGAGAEGFCWSKPGQCGTEHARVLVR